MGFFDPLSKLKLGTFRDLQKKTTVSKEGKTVILRTDRNLLHDYSLLAKAGKWIYDSC